MADFVSKILKAIGRNLLIVLGIFVLSALCVAIYTLGFYQGFSQGKNTATVITFVPEASSSDNLSVTPVPTKIQQNTPVVKPTWGGPELWSAVNKRRIEFGVNPLSQASELCTIASIRLNELLDLGKLDGHEGFSSLEERRSDLKWIFDKYGSMSEFLAVGGDSAQETVGLWENTLGHKKLLSGGEYVWGCIYAQNTFAVAITAY